MDLPGWDRLLKHLGQDWTEHPGLALYLSEARGMGWLNGLLHPPEEVLPVWEQARAQYRREMGWLWGVTAIFLLGVALVAWDANSPLGYLGLFCLALSLLAWLFLWHRLFGLGGHRGWAVRSNPLAEARRGEGGVWRLRIV
ncbi:hypothetical protein [Thermus hydrothermalis]|uniref:hypothetical protein n=1 Tax=Thermus hydrothermalis TaxID=2908148 RepID=UPI001FA9A0BC|nr:hypothetical protein [Thermus hydrothermalis]